MRVIGRWSAATALSAVLAAAAAVSLTTSAAASTSEQPAPPSPSVTVVAAEPDAVDAEAARRVAAMSDAQKAAAVVMGHIPTTDTATLRAYMESTGIGGFILMGANIPGTEDDLRAITTALTVDADLPPLIGIDEEGGDVRRLPWDDLPGADVLKFEPPSATADAFGARGALVERAGIGVNFGIVADVEDSTSSFIYRRALGTTPDSSAEHVVAAVQGESPTALSTLKHFPGHGAPEGDSHATLPETGLSFDEWKATHAVPFRAGIEAGAPVLMYGHLRYTAVDAAPASMSAEWHRIAREDLGFTGVAITDDLGMLQASGEPQYADPVANAVAALAAGNDMVLGVMFSTPETASQITAGIVAAIADGRLSAERLDEAATRVTALRLSLAGGALIGCAECTAAG